MPEAQALDGPWVARMAETGRRHQLTLLLGSLPEKVPGESADLQHVGADRARRPHARHLPEDAPVRHRPARHGAPEGVASGAARRATSWWPRRRSAGSACRSATTCASRSCTGGSRATGARVIAVPSAFTERTGKDHWEVLLRARAIENLAYVVAAGAGRAARRAAAPRTGTR